MTHPLSQTYPTTLPSLPAGTPTWVVILYAFLGALIVLVGALIVFMPIFQNFLKDIRARQNQQSDRMSRLESTNMLLALHTPAPSQPPGETLVPQQRAKVPPPSGEHSL